MITDIPASADGFRVTAIPHMARGGKWRVEAMRSVPRARLLLFTKGQGRITISGTTRGFGANNAVFLPPNTMHAFEMSKHIFGTCIDFPTNFAGQLPSEVLHLRVRDALQQAELVAILEPFNRELKRERPQSDRAILAYADLLALWLERMADAGARDAAPEGGSVRLARRFAALVEEDVTAARTVADYAQTLGVTPTHLTRACKEASGRSAHAILSDRLLGEARARLADTPVPVKKIAHDLGFSSAAYFSRAFQKGTGVSPSDFRKSA